MRSSPSPLNGERAGVRGANVEGLTISGTGSLYLLLKSNTEKLLLLNGTFGVADREGPAGSHEVGRTRNWNPGASRERASFLQVIAPARHSREADLGWLVARH